MPEPMPIGGFFAAEPVTESYRGCPFPEALKLSTGRACLTLILETARPSRVWVPAYICDAAIAPMQALGIDVRFFALDEALAPVLPDAVEENDRILVVDYFGLQGASIERLAATWGTHLIIDQAQAFFAPVPQGALAFKSVRKFMGVPDGAFLLGWSGTVPAGLPRATGDAPHLALRAAGRQEEAFQAYRQAEAALDTAVRHISVEAEAMLATVDMAAMADRRRANFAHYASALAGHDALNLPWDSVSVPYYYPFLPPKAVDRRRLHEMGIFVPTLWPDVLARTDDAFAWEQELARRLLPLPVDHRYGAVECQRVIDVVTSLLD